MKRAILGMTAALALAGQARAQTIDPLVLPEAGLERTYACAGYLNAFSAMLKARDARDEQGDTLQFLYLVTALQAQADAAETGVASEASNRRMSAWDTAVVDATLTRVDANDQFQANLLDCIKLAAAWNDLQTAQ